jgi:hypothetical protein
MKWKRHSALFKKEQEGNGWFSITLPKNSAANNPNAARLGAEGNFLQINLHQMLQIEIQIFLRKLGQKLGLGRLVDFKNVIDDFSLTHTKTLPSSFPLTSMYKNRYRLNMHFFLNCLQRRGIAHPAQGRYNICTATAEIRRIWDSSDNLLSSPLITSNKIESIGEKEAMKIKKIFLNFFLILLALPTPKRSG